MDLAHTLVTASTAGVITDLRAEVGQFAGTGSPVLTLVAVQDVWISAEFTDNNLGNIGIDSPVEILFDVVPGRVFRGHIRSIGLGVSSGRQQAPGNLPTIKNDRDWLRQAQRFPVIISFDVAQDPVLESQVQLPGVGDRLQRRARAAAAARPGVHPGGELAVVRVLSARLASKGRSPSAESHSLRRQWICEDTEHERSNGRCGTIQTLLDRLNKHRLPRLLEIQRKVESAGLLDDVDMRFLRTVQDDAGDVLRLAGRNPQIPSLVTKVVQLYDDITRKALEYEQSDSKGNR